MANNPNLSPDIIDNPRTQLFSQFKCVRQDSEDISAPLEIDDYGIQTMPDVSPPKWHLAHTSWFFETFLLKPFLPHYQEYHPQFTQLFNSYYNTVGNYHPRPLRGLISRPTIKEIFQYRQYINEQMENLLQEAKQDQWTEIESRTILGLNHEQQHQELMLTDIKNIFACNPLHPQYSNLTIKTEPLVEHQWINFKGGLVFIGLNAPTENGEPFAYDNEGPRHQTYINDFKLGSRLITNGEFLSFINDNAYKDARLWLSDAWKVVCDNNWIAPLYWLEIDNEWWHMTLSGMRKLDLAAPVCHVSFYEADAFARWAGKRLPTEAEWETATSAQSIEGNLRSCNYLHPVPAQNSSGMQQLFGDVWEWTQSPYTAYPGYRHDNCIFGDFSGEYNGKFMSNQMVLRGGSCVTPDDHIRASYRNFFYPSDRWQFSGLRLAEDA